MTVRAAVALPIPHRPLEQFRQRGFGHVARGVFDDALLRVGTVGECVGVGFGVAHGVEPVREVHGAHHLDQLLRDHLACVGCRGATRVCPEELRAFYAARQARKGGGSWRDGSTSSGASGSTGGASSGTGSTSGRNNSDCFNSRRPPPIDVDFATIGSNRSATFEQARRAYYDAIQKEHPDRGGSEEQAKCINAAWDRIKRFYGKR